jgi:hypothetical protein
MRRVYTTLLDILAVTFFLGVIGQVLVTFFELDFLPRMAQWYPAVVPYPVVLSIHILILIVQSKISLDVSWHTGFFSIPHPHVGRVLSWLSLVYFVGMVSVHFVTISLHPERRWLTGTIPIFFNVVLAAYFFALGRFLILPPKTVGISEASVPAKPNTLPE